MACFIARMDNFFFYVAMQPDANGEKITFDYMQVGLFLILFLLALKDLLTFIKRLD